MAWQEKGPGDRARRLTYHARNRRTVWASSAPTSLLGFLAACLLAIWWIFKTGWKLKA